MGPNDWWVAECVPCKWQVALAWQDSAITAAEEHVYEKHRHTNSAQRAERKMGHVQLRTLDQLPANNPAIIPPVLNSPASAGMPDATGPAPVNAGSPFPPDTTRGGD